MESAETVYVVNKGLVDNAFFSYYYMKGKKTNSKNLINARPKIKTIIIDSGAHSFFSEQGAVLNISATYYKEKKSKTTESPDDYFAKYKEWIKEYWDYFDYYVELDIGELVGQDKVLGWREELKQAGLFSKCITVVHPEVVNWKEFLQQLEDTESNYIGIEGDRPRKRPRLNYNKYIKECYKRKIKIHGFAMIKEDAIREHPFYSVDSASWKAGSMYGATKVLTKDGKRSTAKFKSKEDVFSKIRGCNPLKLHDKQTKANMWNTAYELAIESYKHLEHEITNLWQKRKIVW